MTIMPDIAATKKRLADLEADRKIATKKAGDVYDGKSAWTQRVIDGGFEIKELNKKLSGLTDMPKQLGGIMKQSQNLINDYMVNRRSSRSPIHR